MIDMHCHIIPGIDDGADVMDTSIDMLKIAARDGIKKMIITPHYNNYFENDATSISSRLDDLRSEILKHKIDIEVFPGQEVMLSRNMVEQYKDTTIRGLNYSRYILFELPNDKLPDYTFDIIYELKLLGVIPILAHPERYEFIINKISTINGFIEEGCLFQITSHSIKGLFGREIQRTAELLIKNEACHFIASDAHSCGRRRPELKKAYDIIQQYNKELCNNLTDNANKLINDEKIENNCVKIVEKKSIFDFFRK